MPSNTQQKADMRAIILRRLERKLDESDPERRKSIALRACALLAGKMTLKELQDWNTLLTVKGEIDGRSEVRNVDN